MRIHALINAVLAPKHLRLKISLEVFLLLLQVKYGILTFSKHLLDGVVVSSVPLKRKKVQNFFRHFCTEILRISAFFLPPKTKESCGSRRLALVYRTQIAEKTC